MKGLTIILAVSLALVSSARAAQIVNDAQLAFTLTLPEGFEPAPRFVGQQPDIVHGFEYGKPDERGVRVILIIERMRGTLGREKLDPADFPAGAKGKLFDTTWDGFELQGFEVHEQLAEGEFITFNVQIPLKPEAIQVKLIGAAARRAELEQLLPQILGGLKGQSNWLRSAASPALDQSRGYANTLLAVAIVSVIIGVAFIWFVARRNRLLGLLLAVAFYGTSWAIAGSRVREMVLLTGIIRMIGFLGFLVAIVCLFLPRKSAPAPAPNQTSESSASP